MGFGCIEKKGANIGFFDCGESSESGELFDTDFAFAGLTETGGIEDF